MNAPAPPTRRERGPAKAVRRPGDIFFSGASVGSAVVILLILAGVAVFLAVEAMPALIQLDVVELHNEAKVDPALRDVFGDALGVHPREVPCHAQQGKCGACWSLPAKWAWWSSPDALLNHDLLSG